MLKRIVLSATVLALAVPAAALACDKSMGKQASFEKLSIEQLEARRSEGESLTILDVNSEETRAKFGVIPGARLLTSSARYDVAAELPESRSEALVFYCGSEMCTASHTAAKRALSAGYTRVYILPAGIRGWVDAGRKVEKPQA